MVKRDVTKSHLCQVVPNNTLLCTLSTRYPWLVRDLLEMIHQPLTFRFKLPWVSSTKIMSLKQGPRPWPSVSGKLRFVGVNFGWSLETSMNGDTFL